MVEWHRSLSVDETDGIEIEQPAGAGSDVRISLALDYCPARFKVSVGLRKLLNMDGPSGQLETRPRILESLWHYIKVHQLQAETRTKVNNNQQLEELFGCKSMDVSSLLHYLDEHLSPPDPIEISIRLGDRDQCYDVQVEVQQESLVDAKAFIGQMNLSLKTQIDSLDDEINALVGQIQDHRVKRQFFLCLHHSPVEFLNDLVASQVRDQQTLAGEDHRASDERQTGNFRNPWVTEATQRYLGIKSLAKDQGA